MATCTFHAISLADLSVKLGQTAFPARQLSEIEVTIHECVDHDALEAIAKTFALYLLEIEHRVGLLQSCPMTRIRFQGKDAPNDDYFKHQEMGVKDYTKPNKNGDAYPKYKMGIDPGGVDCSLAVVINAPAPPAPERRGRKLLV